MKSFNLAEYLKNPKRKVVTKDGRDVRIICTDFDNSDFPVIGGIKGFKWPISFSTNGESIKGCELPNDLFFAPEKNEGWINIYHTDKCGFFISQEHPYKSKREAEAVAKFSSKNFFATAKVEWEE